MAIRPLSAMLILILGLASITTSPGFAQPSSKSEESARETKQEIERLMSDIEKRHAAPATTPAAQAPGASTPPVANDPCTGRSCSRSAPDQARETASPR